MAPVPSQRGLEKSKRQLKISSCGIKESLCFGYSREITLQTPDFIWLIYYLNRSLFNICAGT